MGGGCGRHPSRGGREPPAGAVLGSEGGAGDASPLVGSAVAAFGALLFVCFSSFGSKFEFLFSCRRPGSLWGVGKGPPAGVPWGLVQAELPASCLPLLPGASTASDFTQRKEEEGGSCPPSALGQGCVVVPRPRTKLALGVPHTNIGD